MTLHLAGVSRGHRSMSFERVASHRFEWAELFASMRTNARHGSGVNSLTPKRRSPNGSILLHVGGFRGTRRQSVDRDPLPASPRRISARKTHWPKGRHLGITPQ